LYTRTKISEEAAYPDFQPERIGTLIPMFGAIVFICPQSNKGSMSQKEEATGFSESLVPIHQIIIW
jgi:hypothetical protein